MKNKGYSLFFYQCDKSIQNLHTCTCIYCTNIYNSSNPWEINSHNNYYCSNQGCTCIVVNKYANYQNCNST